MPGGDGTANQVSEADAAEGRGGPSRTAAYVALFRAIENRLPPQRRLFADPYAEAFLDARLRGALAMARVPLTGGTVAAYIDRRWPGARVAVLVRTRFIDEADGGGADRGGRQLVILGSGFDARAYRLESPAAPASSRSTNRRPWPRNGSGSRPDSGRCRARLAGRDGLRARRPRRAARRGGVRAGEPTFFIWEGVTGYLSAEAVDATLRRLAALGAPGSRVVFTYLDAGLAGSAVGGDGAGATIDVVRRAGEPFRFGLDPDELPAYLAERGFELVEQASSAELAARYLHPLGRHPVASPFFRLALAESAPPARA